MSPRHKMPNRVFTNTLVTGARLPCCSEDCRGMKHPACWTWEGRQTTLVQINTRDRAALYHIIFHF